jgi:hypothetical protein
MDPTMVMTFSNPPVGEKSFYKWESQDKNIGNGTMTLARVVNNEEIVTAIEFENLGNSSATFKFSDKGDGIEVAWMMENDVGNWPWSKYMGLMMKSMLKKQFDEGLKGLKFYAEKS